jgi:hypothetical protein
MDIFIESAYCEFDKLIIVGWHRLNVNVNDFVIKMNAEIINRKIIKFMRTDGPPGAEIEGIRISLDLIDFAKKIKKNSSISLACNETVIYTGKNFLLNDFLKPDYDFFRKNIQDPSTALKDNGLRFIAAMAYFNNAKEVFHLAMSLLVLLYRCIELDINDPADIGVEEEEIYFLLSSLAADPKGENSRWYVCLIQALVILKIKNHSFDDAAFICSKIENFHNSNSTWPALSTNIIYLYLYKTLHSIKNSIPLGLDTEKNIMSALKTHINQGDFLFPENFDELVNSVHAAGLIKRAITHAKDGETTFPFINVNHLTLNWKLVAQELTNYFGLTNR